MANPLDRICWPKCDSWTQTMSEALVEALHADAAALALIDPDATPIPPEAANLSDTRTYRSGIYCTFCRTPVDASTQTDANSHVSSSVSSMTYDAGRRANTNANTDVSAPNQAHVSGGGPGAGSKGKDKGKGKGYVTVRYYGDMSMVYL